jgi:hypothetical protein
MMSASGVKEGTKEEEEAVTSFCADFSQPPHSLLLLRPASKQPNSLFAGSREGKNVLVAFFLKTHSLS